MPGISYISRSVPVAHKSLSGGLNSTAGALGVKEDESSDLLNIDFNKFGSVLKRNGYSALNATPFIGSDTVYGLHWFEFDKAGTFTREAVMITASSTAYQMDTLDGTWNDITGDMAGSITNYKADFVNFLNEVHVCQEGAIPYKYDGSSLDQMSVSSTNITSSKYNEVFNNYLFLGNVMISSTKHSSRIYWYAIKSNSAIAATSFIDVAKNDGQEITRIKVLGDRLVVYKTRSIYNVFFTGEAATPFVLPGGGKSNSTVGCIAPYSIQEVDNGHVFLSSDGFYFYDGLNSYKLSYKITATLDAGNDDYFKNAVSMVQKNKNRYLCALPLGTSSAVTNDRVAVWDYFHNAFSLYSGMDASSMCTFFVSDKEERPYFCDYSGFCYRADTGTDDYTLGTATAISCHYSTNWKHYDDLVDKKGVPHIVIYYQLADAALTLRYAYDFEEGSQYAQLFYLGTSVNVYGTSVYGEATYAGSGGGVVRRDLTGRGRVVRFKVENNVLGETFQVDGFGTLPHLETKA